MLSDEAKANLRVHKYVGIETSPLTKYVTSVIFDQVVQVFPTWVHPNVLSILGFLCTLSHFCLLTYFMPNFESAPDHYVIWFITGVLILAAYTFDGIDGKQARRTNTCSPLGELFDHGFDSWVCMFLSCSLFCLIGLTLTSLRLYFILLIIELTFCLTHIECAITRELYIPWACDLSHVLFALCCFISCAFTPVFFSNAIISHYSLVNLFEFGIIASFFLIQIPSTLYNVIATSRSQGVPWHRGLGFLGVIRIFLPFILLFTASTVWAVTSEALINHPRIFFYCFGTVTSNAICHLIVSSMCKQPAPIFIESVTIYSVVAILLSVPGVSSMLNEVTILYILSVLCTLIHIQQMVQIIRNFADCLNVNVFCVKLPPTVLPI